MPLDAFWARTMDVVLSELMVHDPVGRGLVIEQEERAAKRLLGRRNSYATVVGGMEMAAVMLVLMESGKRMMMMMSRLGRCLVDRARRGRHRKCGCAGAGRWAPRGGERR